MSNLPPRHTTGIPLIEVVPEGQAANTQTKETIKDGLLPYSKHILYNSNPMASRKKEIMNENFQSNQSR